MTKGPGGAPSSRRHPADGTPGSDKTPGTGGKAAAATDRVRSLATELIVQFSPAAPGLDEAIAALDLLATQVAPALGWKPETRDPLTSGRPDLF
jgi:hypothetical protein